MLDYVADCLQQIAVLFENVFQHEIGSQRVLHVVVVAGILSVVEHTLRGLTFVFSACLQRQDHRLDTVKCWLALNG